MDHDVDSGYHATALTDSAARSWLATFLGRFTRDETRSVMRARIDAAIERAIAPLSWPARVVMRPSLRFVAELPEWLEIELQGALLATTFSSGVSLCAELGGAARPVQLPATIRGNVRHFCDAERLCTEIVSDLGTVNNMFERVGADELLGHARLTSQHIPLPLCYSMRLRRAPAG